MRAEVIATAAVLVGILAAPSVHGDVSLFVSDRGLNDFDSSCRAFLLVVERPSSGGTCASSPSFASNGTGQDVVMTFATSNLNRSFSYPGTLHLALELRAIYSPSLDPMKFEASVKVGRDTIARGWIDCSSPAAQTSCSIDMQAPPGRVEAGDPVVLTLRMVDGLQQPSVQDSASQSSYLNFVGGTWGNETLPHDTSQDPEIPTDFSHFGGLPLFVNPNGKECRFYALTRHYPIDEGGLCPGGSEWLFKMEEGFPSPVLVPSGARLHLVFGNTAEYPEPVMRITATVTDEARHSAKAEGPCPVVAPPTSCDLPIRLWDTHLAAGTRLHVEVQPTADFLGLPFLSGYDPPGYTMLVFPNATYEANPAPASPATQAGHSVPAPAAVLVGLGLAFMAYRKKR